MKKILVLSLAVVFVLAVALPALAYNSTTVPYNSEGYWDPDEVAGGGNTDGSGWEDYGYNWEQNYTASPGPHGDYQTTTNKCRECHAVHRAYGSWKLLRANGRADGCKFCHEPGAGGAGQNIAMGDTGISNGHHLWWVGTAPDTLQGGAYQTRADGLACLDCHSVHANPRRMVGDITDEATDKLLLGDPNNNNSTGYCAADVDLTDWCADCHGGNVGLHTTQKSIWDGEEFIAAYSHDCQTNGTTIGDNIYTTCDDLVADPNALKVEPEDGTNNGPKCRQCHYRASNAGNNDYFPHRSQNTYVFLAGQTGDTDDVDNTALDDLCIRCHNYDHLP